MQRRRSRRLGVTMGVALGAVAAFAMIGGTSLAGGLGKPAKSQYGPGQYQYGAKVTVCHKGKVTIRVAFVAWKRAHEKHGDTLGPCTGAAAKAAKAAKLAKAAKAAKLKAKAAKVKAAKEKAETASGVESSASSESKGSKPAKAPKPAKPGKPADATASAPAPVTAAPGPGNGSGKAHGKNKG